MLGDVKFQGSNPMKYNNKRILVGIEDSESSTHALEYVADLARGGGFVIHAFHAIGPVPVELREFGGAENPRTERQLDSQLQQKRDHWIRTAKTEARLLLRCGPVTFGVRKTRRRRPSRHEDFQSSTGYRPRYFT
jgi:Universal stress protein family